MAVIHMPAWVSPQLCKPETKVPENGGWLHERKLDGVRAIAVKDNTGKIHLWSRDHKDMTESFPEIVRALDRIAGPFIMDGELVTGDGKLGTFGALQTRIGVRAPGFILMTTVPVKFIVFDLPWWQERDLRMVALSQRKILLEQVPNLHTQLERIAYSTSPITEQAKREGYEGVVSKRANASYKAGARTQDWVKTKFTGMQDFVVGGFTEPSGFGFGFGSLLIGYYEGGILRYAGKVGSGQGIDRVGRNRIREQLESIAQAECPFVANPGEPNVTWVEPIVVVQVQFTEWTEGGKLRHPVVVGFRRDVKARDVRREP